MPAQFENGRKFDSKNSLLDFDAKEKYLHPKNRPVSIQKRRKMLCLRCCFKFIPVRVPFSKPTVFGICRQKICRFRVNRRPIRHIFHRFQNVPASCERSLRMKNFCKLPTIKTLGFGYDSQSRFLWSTLDDSIKQVPTLSRFKKRIKDWTVDRCTCKICR